MKSFLNLMISATLILPAVITFNDNQTKLVSISDNNLEFNIEKFHAYEDLAIKDQEYMGTTEVVDLTALTGISSIEIFKNIYSRLELPDFYAGVSLFTYIAQVHVLAISTHTWLESWVSDSIKLIDAREDIGSAGIYGSLTTKVDIQKNLQLNHLLLRLHFYGKGGLETTGSRPMGEIDSGWVMKLVAN